MGIWDRDGESLLDSMGTWDSKCVWDMIWLYDTIGFQDICRKRDDKWLLDSMGI